MNDFTSNVGQHHAADWNVSNPHPMHGKDPNIVNEFGHTEYPKFLHKFTDKGAIAKLGDKWNDPHDSVVVHDEHEEAEHVAKGYAEKWVKPAVAKPKGDAKPAGWDKK